MIDQILPSSKYLSDAYSLYAYQIHFYVSFYGKFAKIFGRLLLSVWYGQHIG